MDTATDIENEVVRREVTRSIASAKPASKKATELATALDLLARLRDHVEALDGTNEVNEKLMDDYREFMAGRGVYDDEK